MGKFVIPPIGKKSSAIIQARLDEMAERCGERMRRHVVAPNA